MEIDHELVDDVRGEVVAPFVQRCREAVDDRRRRAELVCGERDEFALHLGQLHDPFVRQRAVDRERNTLRDDLQQLDVSLEEPAVLEGADVDDAENTAPGDQRGAEQRLHALLPEDRVQDVRMVDVVDHDGSALGCDAPREAASDGNANTLFDILR